MSAACGTGVQSGASGRKSMQKSVAAPRACANGWPVPSTASPTNWDWKSSIMDDLNFASASADRATIEALLNDQSGCWRRGERLPAEVFLDRRPGLRCDPNPVLHLIYHEILLRSRRAHP